MVLHCDASAFVNVSNGTHLVSEANGTSSPNALTDYDSSISCNNGGGSNTPAGGQSLTTSALGYGDVVTCTITNHRKAQLKVAKVLDPTSDIVTFNLKIYSALLYTTLFRSDASAFVNVSNGTHLVSEANGTSSPNALTDYDSSISCNNGGGSNTPAGGQSL